MEPRKRGSPARTQDELAWLQDRLRIVSESIEIERRPGTRGGWVKFKDTTKVIGALEDLGIEVTPNGRIVAINPSKTLSEQIDAYMLENRLRSRSDAVLELVRKGLRLNVWQESNVVAES